MPTKNPNDPATLADVTAMIQEMEARLAKERANFATKGDLVEHATRADLNDLRAYADIRPLVTELKASNETVVKCLAEFRQSNSTLSSGLGELAKANDAAAAVNQKLGEKLELIANRSPAASRGRSNAPHWATAVLLLLLLALGALHHFRPRNNAAPALQIQSDVTEVASPGSAAANQANAADCTSTDPAVREALGCPTNENLNQNQQ